MGYVVGWIAALTVFAIIVGVLFLVVTRGTRAAFGPRRRLEEELSLAPLRGRLARHEISREEFDEASKAIVGAPHVRARRH